MPTHVYANNQEIVSKGSDGKSAGAFPDVCFTPPSPPVGPLPLPYPNTCEAKDLADGSSKVVIVDKMICMEDSSYFSKSMGDEAATQTQNKGLISSKIQGKNYFINWSMNIKVEGKGVARHMDLMTHNHGSLPGNSAPFPFMSCMTSPGNQTAAHAKKLCSIAFTLHTPDGQPYADLEYILFSESGKRLSGFTNSEGRTLTFYTEEAEEVHVGLKCIDARTCTIRQAE